MLISADGQGSFWECDNCKKTERVREYNACNDYVLPIGWFIGKMDFCSAKCYKESRIKELKEREGE